MAAGGPVENQSESESCKSTAPSLQADFLFFSSVCDLAALIFAA
jgi:hypothetical protein